MSIARGITPPCSASPRQDTLTVNDGPRTLEIKVAGNTITPRQIILAAPRALSADVIPNVTPNGSGVAISGNASITGNATISGTATVSGTLNTGIISATNYIATSSGVFGNYFANSNASYQFTNAVNVGTGGVNFPGAFSGNANPAYVGSPGNFLSFAHGSVSEDSFSYANHTFYFRDSPGGGDGSDPNIDIGGGAFLGTNARFSGNVGIGGGAAPTEAKLVVRGGVSQTLNGSFISDGNGSFSSIQHGAHTISIYANGGIWTNDFFVASSDARIKQIAGRSDAARDLTVLQGIEVTDYSYIDVVAKGKALRKKVIAQQVEKVFPQAVSQQTDVVPDIYQAAPIQNGWVELATDLKPGDRVKLIDAKNTESIEEVLETKEGRFRTDFQPEGDRVFVYGREVKDFRTVDYDAIAMLNVSATQELARKLEAKDAELTKLSRENTALARKVAALEVRDAAREARLARMESALGARAPRPVTASLERK